MQENIITGSIVVVVLASFKLIGLLINKIKKSDIPYSKLHGKDHEYLKSLYDWHNVHIDGRKAWHNSEDKQRRDDKILETLLQISKIVEKVSEGQTFQAEANKDNAIIMQKILIRIDKNAN